MSVDLLSLKLENLNFFQHSFFSYFFGGPSMCATEILSCQQGVLLPLLFLCSAGSLTHRSRTVPLILSGDEKKTKKCKIFLVA